jgi:ABC-type glycerol-3-phosphate transport system permease component
VTTVYQKRPIQFLKYAVLVLYSIFSLLPFIWMLSAALKPKEEVLKIPIEWIPSSFQWDNFRVALFEPRFGSFSMWTYMLNSIGVGLITAGLTIILSVFVGYGFAKFRFRGRNVMMWGMLSTTLLPFSAVLVPLILITRSLGLVNNLWALIVPFALTGQSIFLARQFMVSIPNEYLDAARVDGANEMQIFARIVLPLLRPAVATLGVTAFITSWMQFLWPLVSQSTQGNFTLPIGLSLMGLGSLFLVEYHLWMASAVIAVLPPLIFFLLLEKAYMGGLEALSGLKG